MSNLIPNTDASRSHRPGTGLQAPPKHSGLRTADYRRLLSDMRMRPLSQHAFLKRLLKRAVLTGQGHEFPVTNHAVPSLVDHT